jgi:hypothetical protein
VWVTDVASDGHKLTGHTKNYTQVGGSSWVARVCYYLLLAHGRAVYLQNCMAVHETAPKHACCSLASST